MAFLSVFWFEKTIWCIFYIYISVQLLLITLYIAVISFLPLTSSSILFHNFLTSLPPSLFYVKVFLNSLAKVLLDDVTDPQSTCLPDNLLCNFPGLVWTLLWPSPALWTLVSIASFHFLLQPHWRTWSIMVSALLSFLLWVFSFLPVKILFIFYS